MFGDDEPGSVVLVTDDEPAITMDDVDLTDIVVSALPESELAMPAIEVRRLPTLPARTGRLGCMWVGRSWMSAACKWGLCIPAAMHARMRAPP